MYRYKLNRGIMKTLIVLFVSLTWLSGVLSSTQLVQSESAVIKPGNSHTLTCQASGGFTFGGYTMGWIRQFSDGKLQWLSYINSGGSRSYHNDVKGRFTATRDNNNNNLTLKMDNMKTEDTAVYYCTRYDGAGGPHYFDIWGQGTLVTVTVASPSAPSLFPLISCGTSQEQHTTIGCLAKDFLPDSIVFNWTDKGNTTLKGLKQYNSVLGSGGTYAASSQIKVNTVSWESSDDYYYCTAKHGQDEKTVLLKWPHVEVPKKPIVTIHPPIKDDVDLNDNATIACIASGFFPNNIQISWTKNHNSPLNAVKEEAVSDGNGSFMMTSFITVPKNDWDTDTFSCAVTHAPSDFHEIKNVSQSTVCDYQVPPGEIKVTVKPPPFETIYIKNTAPLTCIVSNMESKDGLDISWYSNKERIPTEIEDPVYDSALRRYRATAIASVCPEDWRTKTFECSVSHPELPRVTNVSLTKANGQDARPPTVLLYPPHPDELAKKETATLSCMVKSFSPADIFVKWIDSDNKEQSAVVTTEPKEEINYSSKKTYFLYSTLTLPSVEDWNKGKSYTCIVGHEKLPLHTTQRTIDKTAGKPTNMNVSLIMSDSC